jgi:ketosteroid isomerase-like protein
MDAVKRALDRWVELWNTYDLDMVEELFLTDDRVTYFSSEKRGLIKGYEALMQHHRGFGFVERGKDTGNRLWLEDVEMQSFGPVAVVKADWLFRRRGSDKDQRGPVTIVYVDEGGGPRIAHAQFSNY